MVFHGVSAGTYARYPSRDQNGRRRSRSRELRRVGESSGGQLRSWRGNRPEMPRPASQSDPSPATANHLAAPAPFYLLLSFSFWSSLVNHIMPEQRQRRQEPEASVCVLDRGWGVVAPLSWTDDHLVWLQGCPPRSRYLPAGPVPHRSILRQQAECSRQAWPRQHTCIRGPPQSE